VAYTLSDKMKIIDLDDLQGGPKMAPFLYVS